MTRAKRQKARPRRSLFKNNNAWIITCGDSSFCSRPASLFPASPSPPPLKGGCLSEYNSISPALTLKNFQPLQLRRDREIAHAQEKKSKNCADDSDAAEEEENWEGSSTSTFLSDIREITQKVSGLTKLLLPASPSGQTCNLEREKNEKDSFFCIQKKGCCGIIADQSKQKICMGRSEIMKKKAGKREFFTLLSSSLLASLSFMLSTKRFSNCSVIF